MNVGKVLYILRVKSHEGTDNVNRGAIRTVVDCQAAQGQWGWGDAEKANGEHNRLAIHGLVLVLAYAAYVAHLLVFVVFLLVRRRVCRFLRREPLYVLCMPVVIRVEEWSAGVHMP